MFEFIKKALSAQPEWPETDEDDAALIAPFKAGALYSIYNGDANGQYGVVKILVIEAPMIHLRVYKESLPTRPKSVAPEHLAAQGQLDAGGVLKQFFAPQSYGIAHLPVHVKDFVHGWKPVYIADSPVTENDLAGYRKWQEQEHGER